jgi:hypothetical protein
VAPPIRRLSLQALHSLSLHRDELLLIMACNHESLLAEAFLASPRPDSVQKDPSRNTSVLATMRCQKSRYMIGCRAGHPHAARPCRRRKGSKP